MEGSYTTDTGLVSLEHLKNDFLVRKSGWNMLHEKSHPSTLQVCMTCLQTDTKLYVLSEYNLVQAYTDITGFELRNEMQLDPSLCVECVQHLVNFNKFREKSRRAHSLLWALIEKYKFITLQNINTINRVTNHLKSNMVKKVYKPNHYDLWLTEPDEDENTGREGGKAKNEKTKKMAAFRPDEETARNDIFHQATIYGSDSSNEFVNETVTDDNLSDTTKNERFLNDKEYNENRNEAYKEFLNDTETNNEDKSINKINKSNENISNIVEKKHPVAANDVENKITSALIEIKKNICISNQEELKISATPNKSDKKMPIGLTKVKRKVNKDKIMNIVEKKAIRSKFRTNLNKANKSKYVHEKGSSKTDVKGKKLVNDDLKMFTVTTLSYEEQVADVRKRKETSNYKNSEYKCSICCKGFSNKHTYNGHMEKHTNKFGELECAICGLHFKYRMRLRHHINNNHTMRYACTECSYVAKQKFSAHLHEQWHKGTKYLCPHCEEQFIRLTTYLSHLRIKHPSDFVCILCGYSFVSQKGMSLHMKLKHRFENVQDPSGPVCESCDIRFASDTAFTQHLKVSPKHSCDGDRTRNDSYVWSHNFRGGHRRRSIKPRTVSGRRKTDVLENTERNEAQIVCEQCGAQQKDFRSYAYHFRKVHPDKNRTKYAPKRRHCLCEHCGKFLPNSTLLKYHMSIHVGVRGFQCDVCDKKFVLKTGLAIHMKTHSDARVKYECPVCGKGFTTLANRSRHVALHSGLKPFKCDFCVKTFATAAEKTLHTSHVHLKKPWPKRERGPRVKGSKGDSRRVRPLSAYQNYETHKATCDGNSED